MPSHALRTGHEFRRSTLRRLAVRDGLLDRDEAIFHYLQQVERHAVRTSPTIDEQGRLSEWPEGFFDQYRKNAARLARPLRVEKGSGIKSVEFHPTYNMSAVRTNGTDLRL